MKDLLLTFKTQAILVIYSLFLYLDLSIDTAKVMFWLVVLDTITGFVKSLVLSKKITLKKLVMGIISKIYIICIPVTLALMGKGIGYEFGLFIELVIDILIVGESISIFGNILSTRNKEEVKNFDAVGIILKTIRIKLISIFESLITKVK